MVTKEMKEQIMKERILNGIVLLFRDWVCVVNSNRIEKRGWHPANPFINRCQKLEV